MARTLAWQACSKQIAMLAALLGAGCTAADAADAEDAQLHPTQAVDAAIERSLDASYPGAGERGAVRPMGADPFAGAPPRCVELQQLARDVLNRRALSCDVDADCAYAPVDHSCLLPIVCGFFAAKTEFEQVSRELEELSTESENACRTMEGRLSHSWCGIADCDSNGVRCDPQTKRCVSANVPGPALRDR
jgi:hypothetical protein